MIIRQPSRLFHVVPHGLTTSQVESLTGYVARLAREHLVTPSALLHRGLEWWDTGEPTRVGEWKRRTTWLKLRAAINAHRAGERWVRLLEQLTGVSGLSGCTMRGWADHFPARGLMRTHLAWCRWCFFEAPEPYDRLIWCLPEVKVCVRHRCRLVERCPNCGSKVPIIHARSVPGYCPSCEMPLTQQAGAPQFAAEEELGIAQLTEEFLSAVATRPIKRRMDAGVVLQKCMLAAGIPDVAALARIVNVSRITGWYWLNSRAVPGFRETLRLCYVFRLSVTDFLSGEIPEKMTPRGTGELALRPARRPPGKFDDLRMARSMELVCASHNDSPPSLVEVAAEVGTSTRVLRRHFPSACHEISQRHRKFTRAQLVERRKALKQSFRDAIRRCRKERARPLRGDIISFLPNPGVLRSAAARKMFDQLLLNLR